MSAELRLKVDAAVASVVEGGGDPSPLLLEVQEFLHQTSAPVSAVDSSSDVAVNILNHPKLVPAVQRLMSCGPTAAQRHISVVARAIELIPEIPD